VNEKRWEKKWEREQLERPPDMTQHLQRANLGQNGKIAPLALTKETIKGGGNAWDTGDQSTGGLPVGPTQG